MDDAKKHEGLPVAGYVAQPISAIGKVNRNKVLEEKVLRELDWLKTDPEVDQRWLAIGRTHIEQAFMAVNRAVFKPTRIVLPGDTVPFRDSALDLNAQPGDRTPEGEQIGETLAKAEAEAYGKDKSE